MSDVVIVGGGIIGLSTAWELARAGAKVVVLDQGMPGQEASWAGAGMIPPGDLSPSPNSHCLAAWSARLWPDFSAELRESTGIDNEYRRCGAICFPPVGDAGATGHPESAAGHWKETPASLEGLAESWGRLKVPVELLDPSQIRSLEPHLTPEIAIGLHLPTTAQVRNPRHVQALLAGCRAWGVKVLAGCPVAQFRRQGARIVAAVTPEQEVSGGAFLVSAGAWTTPILRGTGIPTDVRPVRGQMAVLRGGSSLNGIVDAGPKYLVPRTDGRVLVGATEEQTGFFKQTTVEGLQSLLRFVTDFVPSLRSATVEKHWSGLRPWAPRGRPFMGRAPEVSNLFVSAGHFRAGISNSPAAAKLLRQLILNEPTELDVASFTLSNHDA